MIAVEVIFWVSLGLLALTQLVYPIFWILISKLAKPLRWAAAQELPTVSLIVACHNEEPVIVRKLENALSLDYPPEKLEVMVASDGSDDSTVKLASSFTGGGRVKVLDLPRGGKIRAQDQAVSHATGTIVAFSDANSFWEKDALEFLVRPFSDPKIGYVCGRVNFVDRDGDNQEGLYWRYEMALRAAESRLSSVTAGNGAIYATRRENYIEVDPRMGHDLTFPFNMVKRGLRALFQPQARATEKMVPTVAGEIQRKRRMMAHTWLILFKGGLLNPSGYGLVYGFEILCHRLLRYLSPFLHVALLIASVILAVDGGIFYQVMFGLQLLFLAAALAGRELGKRVRLLAVANYYTGVTASIALGLWDWITKGTRAEWSQAEGTR